MGALAVGSVLLPSFTFAAAKKATSDAGIQLYTFRDEMLKDAYATLKTIANLGIKQVESAASGKGLYYGLTGKQMKQACKDLGMTLRSGHCSIDENWQKTIEQAAESGQDYLVCSSLPFSGDTIENYQKVSERFNKAGEECAAAGLKFGYHNHDFEFKQDQGQTLYDILLVNTDPELVTMEMDLGWVVAAGKNPIDYFTANPGRFKLWHLKDMKGKNSVEFGNGGLDIAGLFKQAKLAGLEYYFVEQEEYPAGSPSASMKINMDYLAKVNV